MAQNVAGARLDLPTVLRPSARVSACSSAVRSAEHSTKRTTERPAERRASVSPCERVVTNQYAYMYTCMYLARISVCQARVYNVCCRDRCVLRDGRGTFVYNLIYNNDVKGYGVRPCDNRHARFMVSCEIHFNLAI